MHKFKPSYILFCLFLIFIFDSCTSKNKKQVGKNHSNEYNLYKDNIVKINNTMSNLNNEIIRQNVKIDSLETLIAFNNKKNLESILLLNDKTMNFNNQFSYLDSIYNSILSELRLIENNIVTMSKSYNEVAQIKSNNMIEEIPPINEDEYKQKYVESLEAYQNGNWEISLEGFNYLLILDKNNDLSDNCQYWVGEIYFKMKKYHNAIIEFNKLLENYTMSNKRDDSLYKLGSCYIKLNNVRMADSVLVNLINNYSESEYVKQARYLLQK